MYGRCAGCGPGQSFNIRTNPGKSAAALLSLLVRHLHRLLFVEGLQFGRIGSLGDIGGDGFREQPQQLGACLAEAIENTGDDLIYL